MVIAQEIGEPSLDKQIQPTTMEKKTPLQVLMT